MAETLFLSVADVRKLVSLLGFEEFYRRLGDRLVHDFKRWPVFNKSSRFGSYSHAGVIELMPIDDPEWYSFKYINCHPGNWACELPSVMGFGCLADVETGFPAFMCEMTLLTGLRTAAVSAVAARPLVKKGADSMAIVGNGAQSEFQVMAFHTLLGINRFHLFDLQRTASERLKQNLSAYDGLQFEIFGSAADAVRGCSVVTTATASKKAHQVLTKDMIEPGMHLNAIGGDCPGKTELDPNILDLCDVFVEFTPQTRVEGEIQQVTPDFEVTELWEVLSGKSPGRTSDDQVTLFDSVGFALEDFSMMAFAHQAAKENSLGTSLDLIPKLSEAKNLFGALI